MALISQLTWPCVVLSSPNPSLAAESPLLFRSPTSLLFPLLSSLLLSFQIAHTLLVQAILLVAVNVGKEQLTPCSVVVLCVWSTLRLGHTQVRLCKADCYTPLPNKEGEHAHSPLINRGCLFSFAVISSPETDTSALCY